MSEQKTLVPVEITVVIKYNAVLEDYPDVSTPEELIEQEKVNVQDGDYLFFVEEQGISTTEVRLGTTTDLDRT